jgi:hypothetical protein
MVIAPEHDLVEQIFHGTKQAVKNMLLMLKVGGKRKDG